MSHANPYGLSQEERQQAAQDLVDHMVLEAGSSESKVRRARRLQEPMSTWFSEGPGWTVRRDRGAVRLAKTPARLTPDLGAEWAKAPLDYELLVWALWYDEKNQGDYWKITEITREIAAQVEVVVGEDHVDWDNQRHRYALRRALKWLCDLGAIEEIDGDVDTWAASGEGDTLYRFTPLARRLELPIVPDLVDAFLDLGEDLEAYQEWLTDELLPRQRLYRTLLLSPALYRSDDPEAFTLLEIDRERIRIHNELRSRFGWDLEVTETYACVLRPSAPGRRLQFGFPYTNSNFHPPALFLGAVRNALAAANPLFERDDEDRIQFSRGTLESTVHAIADEYDEHWGRTLGDEPIREVIEIVVTELRSWGMLRGPDRDNHYVLMPLAGRWTADYVLPDEAPRTTTAEVEA